MCADRLRELLALQSGVISGRQVLEGPEVPADIERMLRRREWTRLLPGVYIDHTGEPTWFHDTAGQRDRDLDRNIAAAVDGRRTVRLGWGQVHERPCWTADKVGVLLQARGWRGQVQRRDCGIVVDNLVDTNVPGAMNRPAGDAVSRSCRRRT